MIFPRRHVKKNHRFIMSVTSSSNVSNHVMCQGSPLDLYSYNSSDEHLGLLDSYKFNHQQSAVCHVPPTLK